MAGWGAAHRLRADGVQPVIFEQHHRTGGHTASNRCDGFVFDQGPHISFTKDSRIQGILAANAPEFEALQVRLTNYWRGHWTTHPLQVNLHGLPHDMIVKIIADFVAERQGPERPIHNYADWLRASFGATFAETFPMQYARKYHLTTADNMTTDWLGPRVYRPNLEEVLRGALSANSGHTHYVDHFRYPKRGGFDAFLPDFAALGDLRLDHKVIGIDPRARRLTFENGASASYDALASSIPLPELVPMIAGVPRDVAEAAQRLACSTCVLVNVGVDRSDLSNAHMSYFYDDDVSFSRISFPRMLSSGNVPDGTGSIQAEVYFSRKYRPLTQPPAALIDPVIADLTRVGILREDDVILHRSAEVVQYANVIFDLDRPVSIATVHGYLDDVGIAYCGRYGDWGYMWTDESFISGERAAATALARCSR
jgi:protoporphyrinogen oxidase